MGEIGGGGRRPRRKAGANTGLEHVFDIMLSDAMEERRVALYARSERELERLRAHCSRRKLCIAHEFVEPGRPAARAAFEELLVALRSGDVNALAVTKGLGGVEVLADVLLRGEIHVHGTPCTVPSFMGGSALGRWRRFALRP